MAALAASAFVALAVAVAGSAVPAAAAASATAMGDAATEGTEGAVAYAVFEGPTTTRACVAEGSAGASATTVAVVENAAAGECAVAAFSNRSHSLTPH